MMDGVARIVPTPNLLPRAAYSRNSIVRGKTSEELLAALDKRMDESVKTPAPWSSPPCSMKSRRSEARSGEGGEVFFDRPSA